MKDFDLVPFENVRSPQIAYVLGFLWADGHVTKHPKKKDMVCTISEKDADTISDIIMPTSNRWRQYKILGSGRNKGKKYRTFTVYGEKFHSFLTKYDYQIKSGASADKILAHIPENLRHYWWRGYSDGDGCFYFKKVHGGVYQIGSVLNQNWDFCKRLCDELEITYRIALVTTGKGCCSIFVLRNEHAIRRFGDFIYQGEQFGLMRKKREYERFISWKTKKKASNSSRYRGVHWSPSKKKWIMQARGNDQKSYECFDDEVQAAKRYDELTKILRPNKAILNFPA